MKRASYRYAVKWIAANDEPGTDDGQETIAGYISTCRERNQETMPNHPNRNWRRQWRVDLALNIATNDRRGVSVTFRRTPNRAAPAAVASIISPSGMYSRDRDRLLNQAITIFIETLSKETTP